MIITTTFSSTQLLSRFLASPEVPWFSITSQYSNFRKVRSLLLAWDIRMFCRCLKLVGLYDMEIRKAVDPLALSSIQNSLKNKQVLSIKTVNGPAEILHRIRRYVVADATIQMHLGMLVKLSNSYKLFDTRKLHMCVECNKQVRLMKLNRVICQTCAS